MKHIAAVVLAAGKGSRMKSTTSNKVTVTLNHRPLISYTINTLKHLKLGQIIVVVGYASQSVIDVLGSGIEYAYQQSQLGTAHALQCALTSLRSEIQIVLSLYGDDSAFYPVTLLEQLVAKHQASAAAVTFLTIQKTNPTGLGRIMRNSRGQVVAIVEEKNATPDQKLITEINTGLYCFNREFLETYLPQVTRNPVSGEYYLTDLVEMAGHQGLAVNTLTWPDDSIWHGVNTPEEWRAAEAKMDEGPSS